MDTGRKSIAGLTRNVFFTGLVSLFMDISSEMVYPLVPLFLTGTLGATKTAVGGIEGRAQATPPGPHNRRVDRNIQARPCLRLPPLDGHHRSSHRPGDSLYTALSFRRKL